MDIAEGPDKKVSHQCVLISCSRWKNMSVDSIIEFVEAIGCFLR